MKFVSKSYMTPIFVWFLMFFVYAIELVVLFPLYVNQNLLIYTQLSLFGLALMFHIWALCKDPGYLKKPKDVDFIELLKVFDPVHLCADCEVIRTDRSLHCSTCNRCVERFDHHCPYINNCVGLNNHGVFLAFLISMALLIFITMLSICTNWNIANNDEDTGTSGYFYKKEYVINVDWIEDPVFVNAMNIICLAICCIYMLLVSVLLYLQVGNFCLNRTTAERFSK